MRSKATCSCCEQFKVESEVRLKSKAAFRDRQLLADSFEEFGRGFHDREVIARAGCGKVVRANFFGL